MIRVLSPVMQAHGVTEIVTFNAGDFTRFAGITAIHPDSVTDAIIAGQ